MENLNFFKINDNGIVDIKISTKFYPLLISLLSRMIEKNPDLLNKIPQWVSQRQQGLTIDAQTSEESDFLLLTELSQGILEAAKAQGFVSELTKSEYEAAIQSSGGQGH